MSLQKQNQKLKLSYSMIIAGIFAALLSGIYSYTRDLALARSAAIYADAVEVYVEPEPEVPEWYGKVTVNLADLQAVNPDVIGWIYFENEPISYPVLYSGDNSTYLSRDYTGAPAIAGAIFIDGENKTDFSGARTLIYGHNMFDDASMFSRLVRFLDPDYLESHKYFQIITPTYSYRYEITSSEVVEPTDPRYTLFNKDINSSDKNIIMLSTCYRDGSKRVLLTSERVDFYRYDY